MPEQEILSELEAAMVARDGPRTVTLAVAMVQQYPEFQDGQMLFAEIMLEVGRVKIALDAARKAVSIDQTNVRSMLVLGRICQSAGLLDRAMQAARTAEKIIGPNTDDIDTLGTLYFNLGEIDDAIRLQRLAIGGDEQNANYRFNLANSLQAAGDLEQAECEFLKVLELDPDHVETFMNLSRIRTQEPDNNHLEDLQRLLAGAQDWETRMRLNFSLAKEFEDIGQYEKSFEALQTGSVERRRNRPYDVQRDIGFFAALKSCFPAGCFDGPASGYTSNEPIFIVGLPRSGTTLTEQILSSHTDVFAAGELRDLPSNLCLQIGSNKAVDQMTANELKSILDTNPLELGRRYVEKTRPRTGHTQHFIDKLPRNSHLAGFVHWALPNAKIVLLDRHPLDVCLSNFKVLFYRGYEYSYNLDDLAEYYIAYRRLMDHWQDVLPENNFHRLSYEALVTHQEQESRKLIEFCGLEWQDSCLEFYKNEQAVTTSSLAQVRQPVYQSAVQRWRHYERQLEPLANKLKSAGMEF